MNLEAAELPTDAVEVGRIQDAWGVKGWFKVLAHSADPQALFSSKRWYLLPPDANFQRGTPVFDGCVLLPVREAKDHSGTVVACSHDVPDRGTAESLKGVRIFVPRSSFPTPKLDEYYWVDLIGLQVNNREGLALGEVKELLLTGPQTVLVLGYEQDGKALERLIPFVAAFVDGVDLPGHKITVDWQADY